MSSTTAIMGIAFFVVFLYIMTFGINSSLLNTGGMAVSRHDPLCLSQNLNSSFNTPPALTSRVEAQVCSVPNPSGIQIPIISQVIDGLAYIGCGVMAVVNAFIDVMNAISTGIAYTITFLKFSFSPCSIYNPITNPFAMIIWLPIFIALIAITMNLSKPAGGG